MNGLGTATVIRGDARHLPFASAAHAVDQLDLFGGDAA